MGWGPGRGSSRHKIGVMPVYHCDWWAQCSCHWSLEIHQRYHYLRDAIKSNNQDSQIQAAVDTLVNHATADRFQLKESKCKELCINICTKTNTMSFDSVVVNSMPIGYQWQCLLVTIAKILGLNVSSDLKWNCHFDFIIEKAIKKYLHSLSQLKCSCLVMAVPIG